MLTPAAARALELALAPRFGPVTLAEARPVGGGCISTTLRVRLHDGRPVFVKLAPPAPAGWGTPPPGGCAQPQNHHPAGPEPPGDALLQAEAEALARLRSAGGVRVPEVLACGEGWLALEWLEPGPAAPGAWERLGSGLAGLHRRGGAAAQSYGWPHDNFIGSLPQANGAGPDWATFWRARRLEPQLARARAAGLLGPAEVAAFQPLLEQLPHVLASAEEDGLALLHGDLWNGNVHMLASGEPAIIDPASYYGHREVDLAMAALFGGFHPSFYRAYRDTWPLREEGLEQRRACYQLYYLLVHVNLFGRSYVAGVMEALRRALGR